MSERVVIDQQIVLVGKDCGTCGVIYGVPEWMDEVRRRDGGSWTCPNGHSWSYTTPEVERLRKEKDRLARSLADAQNERDEAERRAQRAERKVKRVERGVCPHCNRTFANVARHMASKHAAHPSE